MGFRNGIGTTRECRFYNGWLEIAGKEIMRQQTSVKVNTEWQLNYFDSYTAWFVIVDDEDNVYIGLKDGNINVIRPDGLFVALHTWEPLRFETYTQVGYYQAKDGVKQLVVSIHEPYYAHVAGLRVTYILNSPLDILGADLNYTTQEDKMSACLSYLHMSGASCVIADTKGEMINVNQSGSWEFDEDPSKVQYIQLRELL